MRGFFRTLKLCFESRIERRVPESHAIVPWLLLHTCLILHATVKGPDGLTAWFRVRGRHFHYPMVSFAEQVLYKLPTKGPLSRPDGNMGTGWLPATCFEHNVATNNYILAGLHGIEESRAIQRRPESEKWSVDALSDVAATPWSLRDRPDPRVSFHDPAEIATPNDGTAAPAGARRLRINRSDLTAHGYTDGCPQCDHTMRFGKPRPGTQHSERCRARILEAIRDTERGFERLAEHELRTASAEITKEEHDSAVRARAAQVAAARTRLSEAASSSDGPRELGVDRKHFQLGGEMRPPSLVPRGIRLGSFALAHTPMRGELAYV